MCLEYSATQTGVELQLGFEAAILDLPLPVWQYGVFQLIHLVAGMHPLLLCCYLVSKLRSTWRSVTTQVLSAITC